MGKFFPVAHLHAAAECHVVGDAFTIALLDIVFGVGIVLCDGLMAQKFLIVSDPLSLYVDSNISVSQIERDEFFGLVDAVSPARSTDVLFTENLAKTSDLDGDGLFTVGDLDVAFPVVLGVDAVHSL